MRALLGTRKGLILLEKKKNAWKIQRTHFDGVKNSLSVYDSVHNCVWAGVNHGHWGPKLHLSTNNGKTFAELSTPKFPEAEKISLKDFWAFATDSKGRVYLGVEPASLFYSDDVGKTWILNQPFHTVRGKDKWFGGGTDGTCLHSIVINPENDDHIVVGISVAGALETKDRGKTWRYINKGLKANFLPEQDAEIGQDPHMIVMAPSSPNILWQQNHCGLYKSENFGETWQDFSSAKGVKSSFGWGIAIDENNPNMVFTVPAQSDETRIPFKKKLFVQRTKNGGKTWQTITKGLPTGPCYDIVYRHALALKGRTLMFGSTTGNMYFSNDQGNSWKQFETHLPPIFSVKLF